MSSACDIQIELDDSRNTFMSSERLGGTVHVRVDESMECDELTLHRTWKTRGSGDENTGGERDETLFRGRWRPGETYEYPFEMSLPPGPYTYHGQTLEVVWTLEARARLSRSGEHAAETTFVLGPGGHEDYLAGSQTLGELLAARPDDDDPLSWKKVRHGCYMMLFYVLIAPIVIYFLIEYGPPEYEPRHHGHNDRGGIGGFLCCGGPVFFSLGAWLVYRNIRNDVAEWKLGDVDVELSTPTPAPGDELACRIGFEPSSHVELDDITVDLRADEWAHSDWGTDSNTSIETIYEETCILERSVSTTVEANETHTFDARFELPEQAPYSFAAPDNEVQWRLEVHVDIPGWPDWVHEEHVIVRPAIE